MKPANAPSPPTLPRRWPGIVAFRRPWSIRAIVRQIHAHFATTFTVVLLVLLAAYAWTQYLYFQANVAKWDVLFISGLITFIVGFQLALSIPGRLLGMLFRLQTRQALTCDVNALAEFEHRLESRARQWGWCFGAIVGLLLIVANLAARGRESASGDTQHSFLLGITNSVTRNYGGISFMLILAGTGAVGGNYVGRIVQCGLLARQLKQANISLRVQPGHADGVAGLKPIGDFYFYQAMVTALPALFIAFWLLVFPVWTYRDYSYWRDPYLGLFLFAVAFEAVAFVVPVWTFHQDMVEQKGAFLLDADALSLEIGRIESSLASAEADLPRDLMKDRRIYLAKRYQDIENMPTWPVSTEVRTRFTVNNLVLLLPFVTKIVGIDSNWPVVSNALHTISKAINP